MSMTMGDNEHCPALPTILSHSYHFLVYNASVVLWQVCRPFQRPGSRFLYCKVLQTVVRALEDGKEQDFPWRLELLLYVREGGREGGGRREGGRRGGGRRGRERGRKGEREG